MEKLRELVRRWRAESARRDVAASDLENEDPPSATWNQGVSAGMDECADELESILAAQPPKGEVTNEMVLAAADAFVTHPGGSVRTCSHGAMRDALEAALRTATPTAAADSERLDWLEAYTADTALLLHNGEGQGSDFSGLGLKNTGRTLREAIDQARGCHE